MKVGCFVAQIRMLWNAYGPPSPACDPAAVELALLLYQQWLGSLPTGTQLINNSNLHLLSWTACFVPGSQLNNLGGLFTAQDGTLQPDSSILLAGGDAGSASSSDVLAELQRVLRGQDLSQLRGYIGVPPPSASGEAASEEMQMTGMRRYVPQNNEVVVLLSAKIDGKPAVGAKLLVVAGQEDGGVKLELPDGWEELMAA